MRQTGPDKIILLERKDLRFILQPAERGAGNDPVVIFFEFRAKIPSLKNRRTDIYDVVEK